MGSVGHRERMGVNGRIELTKGVHGAVRENARVRGGIDADRPVPPGSGRARGRGSACTVVTDRWGPPVRRRGRARPDWAGLGLMGCFRFFFFHGIFNAFSFYFLYGF